MPDQAHMAQDSHAKPGAVSRVNKVPVSCGRGHDKQTVKREEEGEEQEASAKAKSEYDKDTTIPNAWLDELMKQLPAMPTQEDLFGHEGWSSN